MPFGQLMALAASGLGATLALLFFIGGYFFAVWDARREGAEADEQIGIKLVLYTLCIAALGVAAGGADTLLHYMLSGAKTGTPAIKMGLAGLASGGLVLAGLVMMMLPRTNANEKPKVLRLALGYVAGISGIAAIVFFSAFVSSMIMGGGSWAMKSAGLAHFVTYGAVGYIALGKLGGLSGWTAPERPAAPMPPAGGMPPQGGGGYPPQGGYGQQQGQQQMPQQGGYPPQGQQMPQGGGYPPQGGGYPPQGGGGYPPQGGGGYPPR